ncbi:MAG: DUF4878 domain-containing protein [Anaerolineales bacterium]
MKQDRFLTAILVGIALLVIASLTVFFARRGTQTYQPEDSPEGVIHNYLLALERGDYERAYGYLAAGEGKPAYETFRRDLAQNGRSADTGVQIGETELRGEQAFVTLWLFYGPADPFSGAYRNQSLAVLQREGNVWRLLQMPYEFWGYEWYAGQSLPKP